MKTQQLIKTAVGVVLTLGVIVLTGMLSGPPRVKTQDNRDNDEESLVPYRLRDIPVPLNLEGKDRNLVGLGSYLVNAVATAMVATPAAGLQTSTTPQAETPTLASRRRPIPTVYLRGGQDFGPAVPYRESIHTSYVFPSGQYVGPDIIARNLTPDKTGLRKGATHSHSLSRIMRNGIDFDNLHPTCTAHYCQNRLHATNCIPAPVATAIFSKSCHGQRFHNMTDHQLDAIYEYLSAIPCIDTMIPGQPQLQNDCGPAQLSSKDAPSDSRRRAKSR